MELAILHYRATKRTFDSRSPHQRETLIVKLIVDVGARFQYFGLYMCLRSPPNLVELRGTGAHR